MLTDVVGSTKLWEHDSEAMAAAMRHHDELAGRSVTAHGGSLLADRGEGDSASAVFASPASAVAAACAFQLGLLRVVVGGAPLEARVALHTAAFDADCVGPPVNHCARLRGIAHGGQILMTADTMRALEPDLPPSVAVVDLGRHPLRAFLADLRELVDRLLHKYTTGRTATAGYRIAITCYPDTVAEVDVPARQGGTQ